MAGYSYNRNNFSWTRSELAWTYCRLVALELALKEALGFLTTGSNGGHDVPSLLHSFASTRLPASPHRAQLLALVLQLRAAISSLWCQGKGGAPVRARENCYPYIRYLRHQTDGWNPEFSGDADVDRLGSVVSAVYMAMNNVGAKV